MKKITHHFIFILLLFVTNMNGQSWDYWQQKVNYTMHIDMDVKSHKYKGFQHLVYTNNSPDTISKVYYHLYLNAFQPGSIMDRRSRSILDPDRNMDTTITNLKENEIGFEKISILKQNGVEVEYKIYGTIIKVILNKAILPGDSTNLDMIFEVQIPKLCRRSGRDSQEGIDYSMAQWYPKIAEYDKMGWHPDPYIAREFYGVWGDFDITIDIDNKYIVAAGAESTEVKDIKNNKKRWHFKANRVHDFVWAADRDFKSISLKADDKTIFNYYYQNIGKRDSLWKKYAPIMVEAFKFMNSRYGRYQYPVYNFIEGGDGGMEYPLATLITGNRSVNSLVGISVHEFMHSWYQMQLASNESLYSWMDEGFTSFATIEVLKYLNDKGLINRKFNDFPFDRDYKSYEKYLKSYYYEPMNIHSDHYSTNHAYYQIAYTGGLVFLKQLEYIIGKKAFDLGLLDYFNKWKFKHPKPNDFIRVMEKRSNLELNWYLSDFISTNKFIDFSIDSVYSNNRKTIINLKKLGTLHMPVDIEVMFTNGDVKYFNIPIGLMFGNKKDDISYIKVLKPWIWVDDEYEFVINKKLKRIKSIIIDSSLRMLDVDRTNNIWVNDRID